MPNSTAFDIVNFALECSGLDPIAQVGDYADRTKLQKYQRQATLFLDLVHSKSNILFNKRFMQREFSFDTTAPVAGVPQKIYIVTNQLVENFKANSFMNVTVGGTTRGRLDVMTYELWQDLFPFADQEPTGPPKWIVPLPEDGTNVARVFPWPYADAVYKIAGIARIVAPKISAGTDLILFPRHYEHVITTKLMALLETRMNEGREAVMMMLAQECADEVMRDCSGAYEEQDPMDLGITLGAMRRYPDDYVRDP